MKQFFRFFSLGLFVASLIILIFYNYFEDPEFNPNDFSTDELIEIVEDDGYRVITEEEYISYTVDEDEDEDLNIDEKEINEDKEDKEDKDDNDEEKENKDKIEYTLEIKPGMMPHEVIDLLEEKKIIKDADKFSSFMDSNDYSPYIQQGEFELTSDMSDEELAKEITNK